MDNKVFSLNKPSNSLNRSIGILTNTENGNIVGDINEIPINLLDHFHEHPFKLYEGKRFDDLVESIESNGLINPLVVRKVNDRYETLAGHNRYEAMKHIGYKTIDCIVREDLSDEEAKGKGITKDVDKIINDSESLRADEKVGEKYSLSSRTVARYVRINMLIDEFKEMLDNGNLALRAGVDLSFLTNEE